MFSIETPQAKPATIIEPVLVPANIWKLSLRSMSSFPTMDLRICAGTIPLIPPPSMARILNVWFSFSILNLFSLTQTPLLTQWNAYINNTIIL